MKTPQVNASVKLPASLHARLARLAAARGRSAHSLMVQTIESSVPCGEKREAWRREGIVAWEEYQRTGFHLTGGEVMDWLARTAAGEDPEMPECHL